MNENDAAEVRGYDWCAEAADTFFDNLPFMEDAYIMHVLSQEIPEETHEEYDVERLDGTTEHRTIKTYADLLRAEMLVFIECARNELITSMLDSMPEEEYNARKKAAQEAAQKQE